MVFQELQHLALNNATLPFLVKLANKGYQKALGEDKNFLAGLNDDFDHFEPYLEKSFKRLPILENAGIRKFFSGPESFTPDTQYLLGETPEVSQSYLRAVVLIVLVLQALVEQAGSLQNG